MRQEATIEPLHLADVTLPDFHPLAGQPCTVFAFLVRHPDGVMLVDTGVGGGHDGIDKLYRPVRTPLADALASAGLRPSDVAAVINTHLHFDHCGENRLLPGAPVYVQRAEYEAAQEARYTVREWVDFPRANYVLLDGEAELLPGVLVTPTPGHTPGHQSVVVGAGDGLAVIAGQAAYTAREFAEGAPDESNAGWDLDQYAASLRRLRELRPERAYFSHDAEVWEPSQNEGRSS
ncbi:MAG: N-acyl homoserine lactonase family protein [Dehalococcoidia bacterium]